MDIFARKEILKLLSKLPWDIIESVEKHDINALLSQIPDGIECYSGHSL